MFEVNIIIIKKILVAFPPEKYLRAFFSSATWNHH